MGVLAINFDSTDFMQLLNEARDGDESSVGILLQQYKNYLLLIANHDVEASVKPKYGASDLVQQTMMSAHQNFSQFAGDSEAEWMGWLRTILKNDIHQATRSLGAKKRAVNREVPLSLQSSMERQLVDANDTPGTEALLREDERRLEFAMSQLSDEYRKVIELRSWQELPFEGVGKQMDRSANAARKLWNRAIVQLQRELEDSGGESAGQEK